MEAVAFTRMGTRKEGSVTEPAEFRPFDLRELRHSYNDEDYSPTDAYGRYVSPDRMTESKEPSHRVRYGRAELIPEYFSSKCAPCFFRRLSTLLERSVSNVAPGMTLGDRSTVRKANVA
jgi:hypothetical protein